MKAELIEALQNVLSALKYPDITIFIQLPKNPLHGDFSSNIAMQLSKKLNSNPKIIAKSIINKLESEYSSLILSAEIAGPGFINIYIQKERMVAQLKTVLLMGSSFGRSNLGKGKTALVESDTDIDKAIEFLRKKGISTAEKKGERTASEGLVAISKNKLNKEAGIIEINSETDFVARNNDFQSFVTNISKINLEQKGDLDKVTKSQYVDTKDNVSEALTNLISKIGENLTIRRSEYIHSEDGFVGTYVHNIEKDNMGKIGVLMSVKTNIDYSKINDFLKKISMHVAATNPISITSTDIDQNIINKEKEFQLEEIKKTGKDEIIQKKMLEGKMNKYFNEVVLLEQNYVVDDSIKIKQFIQNTAKELNGSIEIKKFVRFKVGEGI